MTGKKIIILSLILFLTGLAWAGAPLQSKKSGEPASTVIINADLGKEVISKNIFGHFSERLSRCIYEGY